MEKKPIPVTICAIVSRKKILLIKRNDGHYKGLWAIPGGKIEHGEHLSGAAIREIKEEIGIDSKFQDLIGIVSEHLIENNEIIEHFLLNFCTVKPDTIKIESAPIGEVKWFSLKKLLNHKQDIIESDYEMINRMLINKEGTYYNCVMKKENDSYILEKFDLLS